MGFRTAVVVTAVMASPIAMANIHEWEGEAELGALITSGNTEETNISTGFAVVHEVEHWRNSLDASSNYSESDDETTSEKYRASAETDYKFTERQYFFLRGAYEDDRFSGYRFQSSATTGYGNRVWEAGERSFLELSAGVGYRFNKLERPNDEGNDDEEEAITRFAGQFNYELSDTALFRQRLGTEVGVDEGDAITESETSLQSTITGNLSMKVSYLVQHLSDPPQGSEDTDTELSVTLLYGF